jgi:ATP-dependent protease ClpP protease subunit
MSKKYNWGCVLNKKRKAVCEDEDDEEDDDDSKKPNIIIARTPVISGINIMANHIYFNKDIDHTTAFNLNMALRGLELKIKKDSLNLNIEPQPIYLHLTTNGGVIHAAFSIIDCMNSLTIPIYTVVDGYVASAGTLISVFGNKRYIGKNAYILIHELRSGVWGKMSYLEDEFFNFKKVQEHLTNIYIEKTSLTENKLNKILKKDIEWNSEEAIKYGLADEYYGS